MGAGTSVLIIGSGEALPAPPPDGLFSSETRLSFCRPEEDYAELIRTQAVRLVILEAEPEAKSPARLLREIKKIDPLIDIIVAGPVPGSEPASVLIRQGATAVLERPLDWPALGGILKRIEDRKTLKRETFQLERALEQKYTFEGMVGKHPALLEVFALIENIAPHFSSVLITGETGTGKEMVARALHRLGPRRDKPFVVCDCASIPDNLFESELFGYLRGAFTGADRNKRGLFEEAHQGTIFLDEIAEVPLAVQSKLLRVLETHQFRPLGSTEIRQSEVRVVAATSRNLREAVKGQAMREDLFHRLNRIEIHLPPLRERREDIRHLIRHFLDRFNAEFGKAIKGVSLQAQQVLLRHEWPGNVRELENALESAVMLCKKDFIDIADLPRYLRNLPAGAAGLPPLDADHPRTLAEVEKAYISQVLKLNRGNIKKTAGLLGVSRTTLYNKLKAYRLLSAADD
jgi:DNA-binding NtrC family response regulator